MWSDTGFVRSFWNNNYRLENTFYIVKLFDLKECSGYCTMTVANKNTNYKH